MTKELQHAWTPETSTRIEAGWEFPRDSTPSAEASTDHSDFVAKMPDGYANSDYVQSQPLTLYTVREGDYVLVRDYVSTQYGVGDTLSEAVSDYWSNIVSCLRILSEDAENLGDALRSELETLRKYFSELPVDGRK